MGFSDEGFDIKALLSTALKNIYNGFGEGRNIEPELFETTFRALTEATKIGWGEVRYEKPDLEFVRRLDNSAMWFAARKTALQVLQLIALTKDEERGTKRPFREFKQLAEGVVTNYNKNWLKTEYNTAIAAARSARDWQDFEAEADLYPNLEYMRTVSAIPRPEHLTYVGIIRPLNDPFWNTHLPPIDFNCGCSVRNTDASATDIPTDIDVTDPVAPALQNNPGKTGMLFNLPATTYAKETMYIGDTEMAKELKTRVLPEMKFYIKAYEFDNGGSLEIHPSIDESEWQSNVRYGAILAKRGNKVQLREYSFKDNVKNVDATLNGSLIDFKTPLTNKPDKMITNSVGEANTQGAEAVLIDISGKQHTKAELWKGLRGAIIRDSKPHNVNVKRIILMYDKDTLVELTREEIEDYRALNKLKRE